MVVCCDVETLFSEYAQSGGGCRNFLVEKFFQAPDIVLGVTLQWDTLQGWTNWQCLTIEFCFFACKYVRKEGQ